jgi:diguanylate cyclase (GGDEF)-like protein/PAS domain S-box-containing protein
MGIIRRKMTELSSFSRGPSDDSGEDTGKGFEEEQRRKTLRTGTLYALVQMSLLLGWLIVEFSVLRATQLIWYKVPVFLLLGVFLTVRFARSLDSSDPLRTARILAVLHMANLTGVSLMVNAMLLEAHRTAHSALYGVDLRAPVTTAVLVCMLLNYAFSESARRWYWLHTFVPFGAAVLVIALTHDSQSLRDLLDYSFVGAAGVGLALLSLHGEKQHRREYELRRRSHAYARYSRALFGLGPDPIIVHDSGGGIVDWNRQMIDLTGFSEQELRVRSIGDVLSTSASDVVQLSYCARRDGSAIPVETTRQVIDMPQGRRTLVAVRDIRERLRSIETVRKLSKAVEHSPAAVVITDANGSIEYVNRHFTELTGYVFEEVRGANPRLLKSGHQGADFYRDLWTTITAGESWHGEFCNRRKDGRLYWESAAIAPVLDNGNSIVSYVAIKEDVTERRKRETQMKDLAFQDDLTGLANRKQVTDALATALAVVRNPSSTIGLLYLDLNGFKPINDELGHEVGDAVLRVVGERLRGSLRPGDLAGRIGGDEFVILLQSGVGSEQLASLADRIIETIEQPVVTERCTVSVGVSIGIACSMSHDRDSVESILRRADEAMYRAKDGRTSGFAFAS